MGKLHHNGEDKETRIPTDTFKQLFLEDIRTKGIDLVEEREGTLNGYEIKWGKPKAKPPVDWLDTYNNALYQIISKENYLEFIT